MITYFFLKIEFFWKYFLFDLYFEDLISSGGGFGRAGVVDEEIAEGVDGVVVKAVFEG